ncbi:DNA-binding response regulator [Rugamonas sp. FT82W]|uniref:DNA-binding response regulator n=2 Tax=Duganella vulcania TaxID=2692166 RepID=A0A845G2D2_9BURK|nr:DNA-binding response regulator [Duganella vulcania]
MIYTVPVRVFVAHPDPLIQAGLIALLCQAEAVILVAIGDAQVVITDYRNGILEAARVKAHSGKVLVVTAVEKEWLVRSALAQGVKGYLLQSCTVSELVAAVRNVSEGLVYLCPPVRGYAAGGGSVAQLTGRENDVLQLLATGRCNKEIARDLGIGVGTVKTHLKGVMNKLGATARTHAVVLATKRGIVQDVGADRKLTQR